MKTRFAILSVSDKTNIVKFAKFLLTKGYNLLSTGGTFRKLQNELTDLPAKRLYQVSDVTKFPEILSGRVKTLHPAIAGAILANRDISEHVQELVKHSIPQIDVVVCNLYPFKKVSQDTEIEKAVELVDIGGVTLLRSAAKNFKHVLGICNPNHYDYICENWPSFVKDLDRRRQLAVEIFKHTTDYDSKILEYLSEQKYTTRIYEKTTKLKYGCNPHQTKSFIWKLENSRQPFEILNGNLGKINVLDAVGCWGLVSDLKRALGKAAACSFKHTSPAGAAIAREMDHPTRETYFLDQNTKFSDIECAYLRSRNSDPMSSFGDFIGSSEIVDVGLASLIKKEVSDGIIAPGYTEKALEILKSKKKGNYVILKGDPAYSLYNHEFREIGGLVVSEDSNNAIVTMADLQKFTQVGKSTECSLNTKEDMIVAYMTLKYSQSNNVVAVCDGQTIGISAGQQSRLHSVKLAGQKSQVWLMKRHPRVCKLMKLFKSGVKKQTKINAITQFIDSDFSENEYKEWVSLFDESKKIPQQLSNFDKSSFMHLLPKVTLASDAFFPFRDNIDEASKFNVKYIIQPGGSIRDSDVIKACESYGIQMWMTGLRMFTH